MQYPSIICADYDLSYLDFFERVLGGQRYNVFTCPTYAEVFLVLEAQKIQLIIVDAAFEDDEENYLYKTIPRYPKFKDIPVIVTISPDEAENILPFLQYEIDDYLLKPIEETELITRTWLGVRRIKKTEKKSEDNHLFNDTYEILKKIAEGSSSVVYYAINRTTENNQPVALKVFDLQPYQEIELSFDPFFLREAYGMSKLNHRNIVRMLDFGKVKDSYFIAMELVSGPSLETIVQKQGALDEGLLLMIAYQLASVLDYLSEHHVVHRDIKPGNIVVNDDGEVKLTDFGLAKQQNDMTLTMTNDQFMGTPNFVSPEQILGEDPVDILGDLYSLGATLFFCGTGNPPFVGENIIDTLNKNLAEIPPLICEVNPDISQKFSELIARTLLKKPEERPDPGELKAELEIIMEESQ